MFEASLRLLHPVMPFITEEIWHAVYNGEPPLKSIALAGYPQADGQQLDLKAETHMAVLQDLIVSIRNLRAELKVESKVRVPIQVYTHEPEMRKLIAENQGSVERQASVESITFVESSIAKLPGARHTARFDVHLLYEQKIDVAAECERLRKELERIEAALANGQSRLGNEISWPRLPPMWWRACGSKYRRTRFYARRRKVNAKSWAAVREVGVSSLPRSNCGSDR